MNNRHQIPSSGDNTATSANSKDHDDDGGFYSPQSSMDISGFHEAQAGTTGEMKGLERINLNLQETPPKKTVHSPTVPKELIVRIWGLRNLPNALIGKQIFCKLSLNSVHCRTSGVKAEDSLNGSAKVDFEGEIFRNWGFEHVSSLSFDDLLVIRVKYRLAGPFKRTAATGVTSVAIRAVSELGTNASKAWFPLQPYDGMKNAFGELCIGAYWTTEDEEHFDSFKAAGMSDDNMSNPSIALSSRRRDHHLSIPTIVRMKTLLGKSAHKTQEMLVRSGASQTGFRLDSAEVIVEGSWKEPTSDSENNRTREHDEDDDDDICSPLRDGVSLTRGEAQEQIHPLIEGHSRAVLLLEVIQGRGLLAADSNGLSDPYCIIKLKHAKRKTKVCNRTLTPMWHEQFIFGGDEYPKEVVSLDDTLTIIVKDKDTVGFDDDLGLVEVPLWAMTSRAEHQQQQEAQQRENEDETEEQPQKKSRNPNRRLERFKSVDALFLNSSSKWYSLNRLPGMSTVRGEIKLKVSYFVGTGKEPLSSQIKESISFTQFLTGSGKRAAHSIRIWDAKAKDFSTECVVRASKSFGKLEATSPQEHAPWDVLPKKVITGPYATSYTHLQVRVLQARNLIAADANGKSDPYAIVRVRDGKRQTEIRKKTLNPVWNANFEFGHTQEYYLETDVVSVTLKDYDRLMKDDDLGKVEIPLWSVIGNSEGPSWYALKLSDAEKERENLKKGKEVPDLGEVQLDFCFTVKGGLPPPVYVHPKAAGPTSSKVLDIVAKRKAQQYSAYNGKVWFYKMRVSVISASGLPPIGDRGSLTSFVTLTCGPKSAATKHVKNTVTPLFKQHFDFEESAIPGANGLTRQDRVTVTVRTPGNSESEEGRDQFGGTVLGLVTIDLGYIVDNMGYVDKDGTRLQGWFDLAQVINLDESTLLEDENHYKEKNGKDGRNNWKARVKLAIQLTPKGETRLMRRDKLIVRINRAKGLDSALDEASLNITPQPTHNIFIRAWVGSHQKDASLCKMTHGHVVIHEELYFDKLDPYELSNRLHVEICLEETGEPFCCYTFSLVELMELPDSTLEGWFPLSVDDSELLLGSPKSSSPSKRNRLLHKQKSRFANLSVDVPEIHLMLRFATVMEYLEPTLGYVDLTLIKLKMDTNDFNNNLRFVLRYADKQVASPVYKGVVNVEFDQSACSYRVPVLDMFTKFNMEVWNVPCGSTALVSKGKKLLASAEVSIFDLIEYEAAAVFSSAGITEEIKLKAIKLKLMDSKGKKQGSLRVDMRFKENLFGGSLATNANPMSHPKKPFSIANLRHEANRTVALFKGVSSLFGSIGYVLNWYNTPTSAIGLAILVLVCVLDFWTSRFLAIFPLLGLIYVINRHSDRVYGRFASHLLQKSGIGENDTKARLLISVIKGKNLIPMDDNGKSDPLVNLSLLDGKPGTGKVKELKLGRTRTVYGNLDPDWGSTPIEFKANQGVSLIQWGTAADNHNRVPAFEVFVPRCLHTRPILEVVVVGTRSLARHDLERSEGQKDNGQFIVNSTGSAGDQSSELKSFKCCLRTIPHGRFYSYKNKGMGSGKGKSGRSSLYSSGARFVSPSHFVSTVQNHRSQGSSSPTNEMSTVPKAKFSFDEIDEHGNVKEPTLATGESQLRDAASNYHAKTLTRSISSFSTMSSNVGGQGGLFSLRRLPLDEKTISWLPSQSWTCDDHAGLPSSSSPRGSLLQKQHSSNAGAGSSHAHTVSLSPLDKKMLFELSSQPTGDPLPGEKGTTTVRGFLNPKWNQSFILGTDYLVDENDTLIVTLKCSEPNTTKLTDVAYAFVPLRLVSSLAGKAQVLNQWFPLEVLEEDDGALDDEFEESTHLTKWKAIGEILLSISLSGLTNHIDEEEDIVANNSLKRGRNNETGKALPYNMVISAAEEIVEPDQPWTLSSGVVVMDVFDEDDFSRRDFIGRASIPLNALVSDDRKQEQPIFEAWIPLTLRFDNSKADKVLWAAAQGKDYNSISNRLRNQKINRGRASTGRSSLSFLRLSRGSSPHSGSPSGSPSKRVMSDPEKHNSTVVPQNSVEVGDVDLKFGWFNEMKEGKPFGEIFVRAQLVLPEPGAEEAFQAAEEAKKADRAGPIEQARLVMKALQSVQDAMFVFNNNLEQMKNLFNWTHPQKTKIVLVLLVALFVLFLAVPTRYVILFVGIFFFTERFRPLGVVAIKLKHLASLVPTNDDLVELYTNGPLLGAGGTVPIGGLLGEEDSSSTEVSKITGKRFSINVKDRYMTLGLRNHLLQSKSREAQESKFIVSETDCKAFGHLRILRNGKWRRFYFAIAHYQLLFWTEKDELLVKVASGGFGELVEVSPITRKSTDAAYLLKNGVSGGTLACTFVISHPEKFKFRAEDPPLEEEADEGLKNPSKKLSELTQKKSVINTSKRIRTYLVANSKAKRDYWIENLRAHCVTSHKLNKLL